MLKTEVQVPSDIKFLTVVENWLLGSLELEVGDRVDWQRQSNRLRLVLAEAYSNVVRHAHKERPHLPVRVSLELDRFEVTLEIWDCGQGYDLETYEAPNPEDLANGGYGWLIMNRLMDKVEYQLQVNGKNCLKLEANLPEKS